jgi:integrase
VADKVIAVSPLADVPYPRVPKRRKRVEVWEHEVVDALLDAVPDREHGIVAGAGYCGLRQGEAFAVATEDLDFLRRKQLTVRHQVQRVDGRLVLVPVKGGKTRFVPLPQVAADAYAAHIQQYGTTLVVCVCCDRVNHVLFTEGRGLVGSEKWNREVWHPAVKSAGLTPSTKTGLHQLRHFYGSLLIDGGATMLEVQEYMGHASITITADIYGHLFERATDKARSIVDAAFSARAYPVRTGKAN